MNRQRRSLPRLRYDLLMTESRRSRVQTTLRAILLIFYGVAGVVHLLAPDKFLPIVPDWVPMPRLVVIVTGICELAGAIALLTPALRRAAGIAFALYAICVFPANIKHAVEGIDVPGLPSSWWYHGPRLLAQPVLVWAALFCVDVVRWPFRDEDRARSERA